MYKFVAGVLTCALLTTLSVVDAEDNGGDTKAKTQAQIMREQSKACEGLKDQALQECLANYVGPSRDATAGEADQKARPEKSAAPETSAAPQKSPGPEKSGQDAAKGGEHDGSSDVDMTTATKRGPVGPTRKSQPDKQ